MFVELWPGVNVCSLQGGREAGGKSGLKDNGVRHVREMGHANVVSLCSGATCCFLNRKQLVIFLNQTLLPILKFPPQEQFETPPTIQMLAPPT